MYGILGIVHIYPISLLLVIRDQRVAVDYECRESGLAEGLKTAILKKVAEKTEVKAKSRSAKILEILKVSLIPLSREPLTTLIKKYQEGFRKIFSYGSFYYSWDLDITQRIVGTTRNRDNFCWNR